MDYYHTQDLKKSKIYVAPYRVDKERPWLIEVAHMSEAEEVVRKLNAKLLLPPGRNKTNFIYKETITEEMGSVIVYQYIRS